MCIFVEAVSDGQNYYQNKPNNNVDQTASERWRSVIASTNKLSLNLNPIGQIIQKTWRDLPNLFENIFLDEFVIMPNHFHGIIGFNGKPFSKITQKETDLGKIIKRFELESLRETVEVVSDGQNYYQNQLNDGVGKNTFEQWRSVIAAIQHLIQNHNTIWQKSFYNHIIRDEEDLQRIREYVTNNPLQWHLDIFNPINDERYWRWLKNHNSTPVFQVRKRE